MNVFIQLAEQAIQTAQAQGAFDNLPGQGQPLHLDSDPFMPEHLRMAYTVLKNSGYVPEEVQTQREIRSLLECLEHETDESQKMRQIQKVNLLLLKAKLTHSGLLLAENEAYFHKIVSRTTLNQVRTKHI